jgi:hypothetical protein
MNTNLFLDPDDSFVLHHPAAIREYSCSFVAEILVLEIYKISSITRPWTSVSRMSRPLKR